MKNKQFCRIISAVLAVLMLITAMPLNAIALIAEPSPDLGLSAGGPVSGEPTTGNGNGTLPEGLTENTVTYKKWDGKTIANSLQGSGTEESPYLISNGAELMYFADQVNTGVSYSGKYIRLTENIDMDMFNNSNFWFPIGVSSTAPFMGHFDGGNNEIINLSISYDSGRTADSKIYYIGFFGYVKNATVENVGIYSYKLNQSYTYNTEIGAMVAHAENATVTNCYANGEIGATFKDANPLDRSDVITLSTFETKVQSVLVAKVYITDINVTSTNTYGQGVVIDLRKIEDVPDSLLNLNQGLIRIKISGNVSAVRIIGKNLSNTSITISVEDNNTFDCYLDLQNVKAKVTSIAVEGDRALYVTGQNSKIVGIAAPDSTLYFVGQIDGLTISGGTKATADTAQKGATGNTAIQAKKVIADFVGSLSIYGGTGGQGGQGTPGDKGDKGSKRNWIWEGKAGNGKQGDPGGLGGTGGTGGAPIDPSTPVNVIAGTLNLHGGRGGKGGTGGTGGEGGDGGDNVAWGGGTGNGGKGGTGGQGGTGGYGYVFTDVKNITVSSSSATVTFTSGANGEGGNAGSGGEGGAPGTANNMCGGGGGSGAKGDSGSAGLKLVSEIETGGKTGAGNAQHIKLQKLSAASLLVGGLVGRADATSKIDRCAAVVNQISAVPTATHNTQFIKNQYSHNPVTCGHLIGIYEDGASIKNCIAAYNDEAGVLRKYYNVVTTNGKESIHYESWFGGNELNNAAINVEVLNENIDSIGLVYDNGISKSGKILQTRTVLNNRIRKECALVIPDYVFSGRFISAVTKIGDSAFFDNDFITDVVCGPLIEEIGEYAFSSCNDLETAVLGDSVRTVGYGLFANSNLLESITIGASLTEIPDISNNQAPFGIDKSSSSLKSYTVAEQNKAFRSVDGILYELFEVKDQNGGESRFVTVAVIDAPVRVPVKEYEPIDHVVKIYPNAFAYNKTVESVTLDYIREIGDKAFCEASNLKTVKFGNPDVPDSEFIQILDEAVKAGTLQYSQQIGINAFMGCKLLEEINLESEFITKIGSGAFSYCATGTAKPLEIVLGVNVSTIGANYDELVNDIEKDITENAIKNFAGTFTGSNIRSFEIATKTDKDGNVIQTNSHFFAHAGVLYLKAGESANKEVLWLIAYPRNKETANFQTPVFSDKVVTRIARNAFYGTSDKLESVVVSDGVVTIDNAAFAHTLITKITIGKDVRYIGSVVESGNVSVATGIGTVFEGCAKLAQITVDDRNTAYSSVDGVLFNKQKTTLIKYPQNKAGYEFTAPKTTASVESGAFKDNPLIRRITFENAVNSVGYEAFYGCSNLSIVYFKTGEMPFHDKASLMYSKAFETGNSRTIICYGEATEAWRAVSTTYEYKTDVQTTAYTIEQFAGYPTDKASTGYYAVVVVDKSGNPLNHVYVELGDNKATLGTSQTGETVKTQAGIAMFYNLDYKIPYTLRVVDNLGEYFPLVNPEFYLDEYTHITYITLSSVPTVAGVKAEYDVYNEEIKHELGLGGEVEVKGNIEEKTVDINSETAKINKHLTSSVDITLSCGVDVGTSITKLLLLQGGVIIQELQYNDTGDRSVRRSVNITLTVDAQRFADEQDVYAVAVVQNDLGEEQQVQIKLPLHVFTFAPAKLELPTSNQSITVKMPDELKKLLGLDELSPLGEDEKLNFVTIMSEDSYRVAIEFNREKLKKFGFDKAEGKDVYDLWEEWVNNEKLFSATENKSKGELGFSFGGFVEQKYRGLTEEGDPDILVSSGIKGSLEFTYGAGTTLTLVVVPIRLDAEVKVTGELELELEFDKERAHTLLPSGGDLDLGVTVKVDFYAGVGCALASAGVYGNVQIYLLLELLPNPGIEKFTAKTDLGIYVKYDGLFVKWKRTWSARELFGIPYEWVIIDREKEQIDVEATNNVILTNLLKEDNYIIASSSFDPNSTVHTLSGLLEESDSAYEGISPKMLQVGDLVYIVYQDDLARYSEAENKYYYTDYKDSYNSELYDLYNYQKLVYQVYNTKTGELSPVTVLDDNGLADGSYELYSNGTNAVIVYTQLNKRLTSGDLEDMAGYVGALEVKTAVLGSNGFGVSADPLTCDEFYDMNLRVGEINGMITAVWVQNAENSLFGTTENNNMSIWFSVYDGESWSTPACLRSNLNTVTDIEIAQTGVVFVTDQNNSLESAIVNGETVEGCVSDRVITLIDLSDNSTTASTPNAYLDVSVINGCFVYYLENNLHIITPTNGEYAIDAAVNKALFGTAIGSLTERYVILEDSNQAAKAILYVETEETFSNVYGIFCENGTWGAPIKLTNYTDGSYVNSFDATDLGGELLLSVLVAKSETSAVEGEENEASEVYSFDTYKIGYPTDYAVGKITFDYDTLIPNQDTVLTVPVTNNGYRALSASDVDLCIKVTVTDRNGNRQTISFPYTALGFYDESGAALENGQLLSGNTGYLKIRFNPGDVRKEAYDITVNGTEQAITLWYSDFMVYGKQILIGDTYHIIARVTNNGYLPAAYTLTAKLGENTISEQTTDILAYGETQYFTVPLESTEAGNGSDLIVIGVNADGEQVIGNNEHKINIATDEIITVSTDSLSVWLSQNSASINRTEPKNVTIGFDSQYTLVSATINGTDITNLCTATSDTVTLKASAFAAAFGNGTYTVRFQFTNGTLDASGNPIYKYATLALTLTQTFTVSWVVDGVETNSGSFEIGSTPEQSAPQKPDDAQYTYTFVGWDTDGDGIADETDAITKDTTYVAIFSAELRSYEIVWNVSGSPSKSQSYLYGSIPSYGTDPQKASDAQFDYVFKGWDHEISEVNENVTYTAVFDAVLRQYTVTWIVDGISSSMRAEYGTTPALPTPTKASDAQYHYSFAGWSPKVSPVYGNQTYEAQFDRTVRRYTVTWIVDGAVTKTVYEYGASPVYEGTPNKEGNAQYSYLFTGWDSEIATVTSDVTYTAIFEESVNRYTVSFIINGTEYSALYEYGTVPQYNGEIAKPADETYRYVFSGWDKEIVAVVGDAAYEAKFDAIPIGSATIGSTACTTGRGYEFTTLLTLSNVQNLSEATVIVYYNPSLVTLKASRCGNGVEITAEDTGSITLRISGLSGGESREILELTFVTLNETEFGEFDFIEAVSEDRLTSRLGKLNIRAAGDVNSDGAVDVADVMFMRRHLAGWVGYEELNALADMNRDGIVNAIDVALLKRYLVNQNETVLQ